jgi:hypothetical protein
MIPATQIRLFSNITGAVHCQVNENGNSSLTSVSRFHLEVDFHCMHRIKIHATTNLFANTKTPVLNN